MSKEFLFFLLRAIWRVPILFVKGCLKGARILWFSLFKWSLSFFSLLESVSYHVLRRFRKPSESQSSPLKSKASVGMPKPSNPRGGRDSPPLTSTHWIPYGKVVPKRALEEEKGPWNRRNCQRASLSVALWIPWEHHTKVGLQYPKDQSRSCGPFFFGTSFGSVFC